MLVKQITLAILLILAGMSHTKVSGFEDFKRGAVILFAIHSWDCYSDILFTVDLWIKHISDKSDKSEDLMIVLFAVSICFVLLPMLKNLEIGAFPIVAAVSELRPDSGSDLPQLTMVVRKSQATT